MILKNAAFPLNLVVRTLPAAAFAITLSLLPSVAAAQTSSTPAAPAAAPQTPIPLAPAAPKPTAPPDPLPTPNPRFFTSPTPTVDTVNAFLHQIWGFDKARIWRVMGIQPTRAPGVIKVVVFVTTKAPDSRVQSATFFVTPDGKHAIGEGAGVVPFGPTPFAELRELLKARADGPSRGAPSKDLEFVEFADLQCPVCKQVQSTVDQLIKDFPKAHYVFQPFPLVEIHTSAFKAAAYGVCAQKQSDDTFFKYAAGVFDTQEALSPKTEDTLLRAAAMRAGLEGDATVACANSQATKDQVNAYIKLAEDAGIEQTPMLSVNGRLLPLSGIPYDSLKQIIQFQADLDHVESGATAETLAPTPPPPPTLKSLPK